jgi:serine/threonine protein kinase
MPRYSGTLRKQMGSITQETIMVFFSQILDGVEAAHLAKVWHRDLKPENILYEQRQNRLVVADFGIAHFEEEEIFTAIETKAIDRLANFQYSAPEQRVRNSKVDSRADIFALGLILNEMFTGEILQGIGHKRIADVAPDYGYLDGIVEAMSQQNPANRPESIEKVKMELIGRRNAFIALQKYDDAKRQVVPISEVPEFIPVQIVSLDYDAGTLNLKFSRNVPPGWAQEFNNPRGGHSALMGYGPEQFAIRGDAAVIGVRDDESFIQKIVDHAKNYVEAANCNYALQMQEQAAREERQRRAALEKQIAEAEKKKNILANIKL